MPYTFETKELKIGNESLRLMEVKSSDDLFNDLIALGPGHEHVKDERIPYWAELWPSAIGLATHILQSDLVDSSTEVIEIGCGLGLPGIAAGKMGAQVIFTDYMSEALEVAEKNWMLNHASAATFQVLDWRNLHPSLSASVLLASDVAYEKKAFEPLLQLFDNMLMPGGTIMISEPGRKYMDDFFSSLSKSGYQMKKFSYPVFLRGINSVIGVYEIKK